MLECLLKLSKVNNLIKPPNISALLSKQPGDPIPIISLISRELFDITAQVLLNFYVLLEKKSYEKLNLLIF